MSNTTKGFLDAAEAVEKELLAKLEQETPEPEPILDESKPEPEPEPEPEPAPALIEEEKYKAAVKAMNEAQRKAAEAAKREEEFNKEKADLQAKLNEALERAKAIANQRTTEAEPDDELEADMPEVARLAEKKARKALTPLEQRLADIEKALQTERERNQAIERETKASTVYREVKAAHPDYEDLVSSEEMVAWINNEAPPIYKAIFEGTVEVTSRDAIAVLNAYKQTLPAKSQTGKPSAADIKAPVKVQPSVSTQAKTKPVPTKKEMEWFMHNAHKLTPAQLTEWEARLTN